MQLLADSRVAIGYRSRLGHPIDPPPSVQAADLASRRETLLTELYATPGERPVAAWVEVLEAVGVPCGPVNDVRSALADPQARARGVVQTIDHPELGTVAHIASPLRLSTGVRLPRPAPVRGADTAAVFAELGGEAPAAAPTPAS